MILISKYLIPKGYLGLAFFPFLFLKNKELKSHNFLINHEKIHLRQQLELLIIPFYLIYIVEFLFRLIQYRNYNSAYRNLSFEKEAYLNEKDLNYIKSRHFWNFINYM